MILGLNSDKSIKLKGKGRPIVEQKDRVEILSSFPFVDKIVVFDEMTPIKLIKKIKPHIIFKGKDYKKKDVVGFHESKKWHGKVILIDFIDNKSTTSLIQRIRTSVTDVVFLMLMERIAETEELHRRSFNESFKEFNLNWFWDKPIYKELINIGGGKEELNII